MYKTVLKKRSANITRRNISPRTENNEPSEPTVIEVPRIEINYIYPKIRSTVPDIVKTRTLIGAKKWTYVDDAMINVEPNTCYDTNEGLFELDINKFRYGDTVEFHSKNGNAPSEINCDATLECNGDVPRLALTNIYDLNISNPVAMATSLYGQDLVDDIYTVITDNNKLYIYSENKKEIVYQTQQFNTLITSLAINANIFWGACPGRFYNSSNETFYSLFKGTINYNELSEEYTVSYTYYFTNMNIKKVILSKTQFDLESIGNIVCALTDDNMVMVSTTSGSEWYDLESLSDQYTWNDMSLTTQGILLIVGVQAIRIINIYEDSDFTGMIPYLEPENWISCDMNISESHLSIIIASKESVYVSSLNYNYFGTWFRLPINEQINKVHTVFLPELYNPGYVIATKSNLLFVTKDNDISFFTRFGFTGDYTHLSFNWQNGVYTTIQKGTHWTNNLTLQSFFILDLLEQILYVDGKIYLYGNVDLTLRKNSDNNITLSVNKDSSGILWVIPNNSSINNDNITPNAQKVFNINPNAVKQNLYIPMETQPQRKENPKLLEETGANIIIPTLLKFVPPQNNNEHIKFNSIGQD